MTRISVWTLAESVIQPETHLFSSMQRFRSSPQRWTRSESALRALVSEGRLMRVFSTTGTKSKAEVNRQKCPQ